MSVFFFSLVSRLSLPALPAFLQQDALSSYMPLILTFLGSSALTAFITYLFTRRKLAADTTSSEVDADKKMSDLLKDMQNQVTDLYRKNIELEKHNTDLTHQGENLQSRLNERDSQLAAMTKQYDLLRNLAEQAPITDVLRSQLENVIKVNTDLQAVQVTLSNLLVEKEKTIHELFETNRDIQMPNKRRST